MFGSLWIGIVLAFYTILNIVIPLSGSATVTPLLALLTDPHKAIGLAVFYFFISSVIRLYFFRKFTLWEEAKSLMLPSALAALVGSLSLVVIPASILYLIVFVSAVYFLLKKLKIISQGVATKHTASFVGITSGFLQGTGLAGSDLRNSYLYSQGLSISEVHGTTTVIAIINFFIATVVRFLTHQVEAIDLSPVIYTIPFIILGVWGGKFLLGKISKKHTDYIIVTVMAVIVIALAFKLYKIW